MPFRYVPRRWKDVVRCPVCGAEKDIERHVQMKVRHGCPLHKELLRLFYETWGELAYLYGEPNLDYGAVWRAAVKKYRQKPVDDAPEARPGAEGASPSQGREPECVTTEDFR